MEFPRPEDQMDLASSPARLLDDIDLELDDFREATPLLPPELISEDPPKQSSFVEPSEPLDIGNTVEDQAMSDGDVKTHQQAGINEAEVPMTNGHGDIGQAQGDDDFLYDDDEDLGYNLDEDLEHFEEQQHGQKVSEAEGQAQELSAREAELEIETKSKAPIADLATESGETDDLFQNGVEADIIPALGTDTNQTDASETAARFLPKSPKPESSKAVISEKTDDLIGDLTKAVEDHEDEHAAGYPQTAENDDYGLEDEEQFDATEGAQAVHSDGQSLLIEAHESLRSDPEDIDHQRTTKEVSLHPVKVQYLENWMNMFPCTTDNDGNDLFFLDDFSLAQQTLDKMLCACRDVLAESIDVHDELVLDVPSLGLHISEGSRHAAQISLSQILDVYLALARNEETGPVKPLICSLRSRVSLASQYAYMQSFAKEGKTLTAFVEENEGYVDGGEEGDLGHTSDSTNLQGEYIDVVEKSDYAEDPADEEPTSNLLEDHSAVEPLADIHEEEDLIVSAHVGEVTNDEGEYDSSDDIYRRQCECLDGSCANCFIDASYPAGDPQIIEDRDDGIFDNETEEPTGDDLLDLNLPNEPHHIDETDRESVLQESISSNTIEADNELGGSLNVPVGDQSVPLNDGTDLSEGHHFTEEEIIDGNNEDVIVNPAANVAAGDHDNRAADLESSSVRESEKFAQAVTEPEGDDNDLLDYETDNEEGAENERQGHGREPSTPSPEIPTNGISHQNVVSPPPTESEPQESAIKSPTTPSSDKKRKVVDDDDEFDLLDLDSPEKKRGRSS